MRQGVFFESFVSDMSGRDDFRILFVRSIWMGTNRTNAPNEYRCARIKMSPHDRFEGTVTVKSPGPEVVSPQQIIMASKVSAKLSL